MMYRVYVNDPKAEHIWSVDEGTIETETQWDDVFLFCDSQTDFDFTVTDRENNPVMWLWAQGVLKGSDRGGRKIACIVRG